MGAASAERCATRSIRSTPRFPSSSTRPLARTSELEQDIAHVRRTLGAEINRVEACTLAALEKQARRPQRRSTTPRNAPSKTCANAWKSKSRRCGANRPTRKPGSTRSTPFRPMTGRSRPSSPPPLTKWRLCARACWASKPRIAKSLSASASSKAPTRSGQSRRTAARPHRQPRRASAGRPDRAPGQARTLGRRSAPWPIRQRTGTRRHRR